MKKRIRFGSVLLDILVVFICITGFYYSLKNFSRVLNRSTIRTDVSSIGVIEYRYKVAQRKFSDRVVWERLQQKSLLYNGDYIRTSSAALATIIFNNESRLELGENTMVQIILNEDGDFIISLDSGSVEIATHNVKNNSQMELKTSKGSSVVLASDSSLSVKADSKGESNLTIKKGQAVLVQQDGLETKMSLGQTFVQKQDGKISKKAVSASVPQNVLKFESKEYSLPMEFHMDTEYKDEPLVIQTSSTPDFSAASTIIIQDSDKKLVVPVQDGKIYWRAYPKNNQENVTDGYVNVVTADTVRLESPVPNATALIENDSVLLNFSWSGSDYVSCYNFQLATDSKFTNIVHEQKVYNTSYSFNWQSSGDYYWRIIPFYEITGKGYAEPSETRKIVTLKKTVASVGVNSSGQPELIYPAKGTKIFTGANENQLTFIWDSSVSYDSYLLLVSNSRDFNNPLIQTSTEEKLSIQKLNQKNFIPGTYYWKVIGKQGNSVTVESSARIFYIEETESEAVKSELYASDFKFPEDFAENGEASAVMSVMQKIGVNVAPSAYSEENSLVNRDVYKNDDSKPVLEELIALENQKINDFAGVDEKTTPKENKPEVKSAEEKKSEPAKKTPAKNPPAKQKPAKQTTAKPAVKDAAKTGSVVESEPVVSSKKTPEAEPAKKETSKKETVKKDTEKEKTAEKEGTKEEKTKQETTKDIAESGKPQVESKPIVQVAEPVLQEPGVNFVIGTDYIKANRKIVFIWSTVENATDYTFELYQIIDGTNKKKLVQEKNLVTSSFEYKELTKLTNGTFEWRITAYNHTGNAETTTHSKQVNSLFIIQIDLPTKITPINPGKQYGE